MVPDRALPSVHAEAKGCVKTPTLADPQQAARAAKLIAVHEKIRLTPEERVRVATWVDTNAQFYGMYWDRRNLQYKDRPDFRPTPSFDLARSLTLPAGLAAK